MKKFPFALIAIALYPILFLYSRNLEYVSPVDLVRPLAVSFILIFLLFALFKELLKEHRKAALASTLAWALFSIYGHVYQSLHGASMLGRHSLLGPIFIVLFAAMVAVVWRSRSDLAVLNRLLNAVLGVLLLLAIFALGSILWKNSRDARASSSTGAARAPLSLPAGADKSRPDVYYIILDTYSRADVIEKRISLPIYPFLDELKQRGFVTADCSLSNYDSTRVSLASSLNMDYIPNLDARFTPDNPDNAILDDYILHSKVRATFESLGYQTVAFATGFAFTEMTDAGEYLSPPRPSLLDPEVRPFEALWLKTTGMRILFDTHPAFLAPILNPLSFPHGEHVRRQQFLLAELPKLVSQTDDQPKFVFAHVILPHVPFVFRADGSINTDDRYFRETFDQPVSEEYLLSGYRNQVEYLNSRLIEIVDGIQRNSSQPPVIILQGDHGLLYYEHNPILNAYFFPGKKVEIPATITPVNTFRLLFNTYFGANLSLLPDLAYNSTYTAPYDFKPAQFDCPIK